MEQTPLTFSSCVPSAFPGQRALYNSAKYNAGYRCIRIVAGDLTPGPKCFPILTVRAKLCQRRNMT